ncbi:ABC transporter ATP-binding protein [Paenibacillus sacheonensis]|uniref:ATP-binding cassette domain-containing protein n=1 Tax=Paenibacillus sacheonensis TaxID=742054 RepID=A0A7X4YPL4_9BACL|nr:ABC transporter ATP-binding protein [Paenibacillus sacheonensis]MBM7565003.1 sn-glycerol 3-phosphate transport system ATP-binding protein [Paenibacillus sacheonensis]NBC70211.1 ATP-binding cassette domain-containing protein [Paenibacillus sacheonensis]
MAKIELKQISKKFKDETIIENLNLTIKDGSFTVLVGPSGCGKSTTLRMVAGLEKQSGGEIWIDDKCVNDTPPGLRDVAMVFQNYALYPNMTVRGNIEFGLKNMGIAKQERERLIMDICGIVGLVPHLNKKPQSLSGGQRQRVALARAMVKQPKVFILDEPLSNLDAKLRNQMRTELIQLHKRLGTTFVYVTHDQVEAMSMGDEIVVMNKGVIQQADTPMKLYHDPANQFTAEFIGTPAMNMMDMRDMQGLEIRSATVPGYAGFRPEQALIGAGADSEGYEIEGEILTRESLGAENIYQIQSRNGVFFVKTFLAPLETMRHVKVTVPYDRLYYFGLNGERLRGVEASSKRPAAVGGR